MCFFIIKKNLSRFFPTFESLKKGKEENFLHRKSLKTSLFVVFVFFFDHDYFFIPGAFGFFFLPLNGLFFLSFFLKWCVANFVFVLFCSFLLWTRCRKVFVSQIFLFFFLYIFFPLKKKTFFDLKFFSPRKQTNMIQRTGFFLYITWML